MTRQLRVLILEDRPSDAELMLHELRQSGFEFEWERVETEEGYLVQLDPELDVILADYSLPQFDAMRALRLLQERGLDIPFIVVTGSVGEETAVACMKQGATDYLLKDRMARLAPAVEQALEAKQLRDERRLAQIALGESHSRFLTVLGGIDAHVYAADLATYEILFMNKQMQEDFGGNLVGKICWEVFRGESGPCPHCTNDKLLDADSKPTGLHVWEGQNPITGRWYLNYDRAIQWVDGRLVRLQVATDITERKLAEKALRESEARYRSLFEGVPVGLYRTTRKGKITDANPILVEMLGYPDRESLLGLSAADVFADAEEHSRQVALLEQDGELHGFEAQMRRSDGTTLWVRGTARAVRDDEGRVCSFEGSLEDVTGRKQAEGRLSAINALGKELMLSRDVGEIARSVADAAQEVLRFPICGLWLVDEKQNRLIRRAHTAGTNAPVVPPLPLDGDQGITVGTARSGQPICVPDVSQDPRYVAGSRQTLSELCVPLKVGDRVIGVLNAESDQLNAFGPADRQLLEALASVAAIALENARLYRETRELATFNEGIVQSMAEGIVVQDAEGYFTFVNPAGADLVGYTPAELTGKHWTSLVPPGQQPIVREADERRERGESDRYELEVVGKDGTRSSVLVSGSPRFDEEGRFVGTLAVFTDISRRKRAEEELGQRAAQLALLNDIGGKIAAVLDLDSVLDRAAALVQESFGYHHVALFTLNRDQGELIMRAAAGDFADLFPRDHWVELGQGLVGSAAERGESILAGDVAAGPSYVSFYPDLMPTRSELSIPIRVGEQVAGVLDIQSTELDAFNENDRMVMETLADQIAVAIENARLYEEAEQRALEQETLREAALAVTTALEREEVIERILAQLQKVVRYDTASVQLLKDERLEIVAARGFPEPEKLLGITVDPSRQDNPNSEVVRTRAPVVVDDVVPLYAEFGREPHAQAGIRSWLGVPMVVGERLIGMIALDKQEPDFYTEESARMAEAFAAQAAIAFDNARLHSETKRRLQEQIALREAGAAITSTLDLETLLARIAEQLGQAIDATSAYICPYSPVSMTSSVMAEYLSPHACDRERVSDLGAAYPYWEDDNEFLRIMEAGGHDISHVDDPDISEVERTHLKQHGGRSVLYIPLRVKDRALGYAELWESRRRREFTDEEIELCQAIARNASIAIENARLFEAERKQRALSEALAEAAAIVSSTLDPDQVLDRILEQVERVVAGDAFNVMLIEENTARVVRWRGYEPAEEEALSVQIGKYPNLMNMMQTEEPIVVQDTKADPDWVQAEGREWWRSYVAAPIRVTGLTVGLLNVIGRQPGQFGPADARLLEGFARHAAIAIENAQLYRELRSHADHLEERVQEGTAQIQAQFARLQAILRSASDGIIVTDGQGEILQVNPVARAWLTQTLSRDESGQLRRAVRDLAVRAEEQPEAILELTGLDLQLNCAPILEPAGRGEAVVAVHDVSHLKALDRMKSRFVSNVSHELRTPITTIKLYASLMRSQPERWKEHLEPLAEEAERQARLVEDILQVSRMDAGRMEIDAEPTALNELTEAAVENHQVRAQEQGVTLHHRPAEPGPVALVDPARMMQVLHNLLVNAIHYTPEGGEATVSTGEEKLEAYVWATITVEDTGIGIPDEELPHIFSRFFRGGEPQRKQIPGTGLGLAIVKEIVELHGGHVTVESEVGAGSTFTVWLPTHP